jgi:hypothetical protein
MEFKMIYKIFTIGSASGIVEEGATVEKFKLSGAGIYIPAILVGEEGRGRKLGVLPVQLLEDSRKNYEEKGEVKIFFGELGQTRSGYPKLFEKEGHASSEEALVVFRTKIGFRGWNSHGGDRVIEPCPNQGKEIEADYRGECPLCGIKMSKNPNYWIHPFDGVRIYHSEFPGKVIVEGIIAQGQAGRMGSGKQIIALVPRGIIFSTQYGGRLYGAPSAHYYVFNGSEIISATWKERQVADIF